MAVSANFLSYVIDQLSGLGTVRSRRMFGGIGLYCDEFFFGLIDDDVLYFKVDDSNCDDYTSRGSNAFRPVADDPNAVSMSYFNVPEDVLEDSDEVRRWARKSVAIAAAAAAAKAAKKSKNKKPMASPGTRKASPRAAKKTATRSKRNDIARASTSRKFKTTRRSRPSKD
jgi:DNA transformation protein